MPDRTFHVGCPACYEDNKVEMSYTDGTGRGFADCECGHRLIVKDHRNQDATVMESAAANQVIDIEYHEVDSDA